MHANHTVSQPIQKAPLLDFVQAVHNPSMRQINSAVIWLHGLGANGHDFAPIVPELRLPVDLSVRFVFPNAPSIPVTINGGHVMPAWYDILEMSLERKLNETQLKQSAAAVHDFIAALVADGIPPERIIVAGFSQGGAVAYEAGLAYEFPLAGVMTLSTYFATKDSITYAEANKNTPVFIGHGLMDDVVPESFGKSAHTLLLEKGYQATYNTYPTAHGVFPQEIDDIGQWITECLS